MRAKWPLLILFLVLAACGDKGRGLVKVKVTAQPAIPSVARLSGTASAGMVSVTIDDRLEPARPIPPAWILGVEVPLSLAASAAVSLTAWDLDGHCIGHGSAMAEVRAGEATETNLTLADGCALSDGGMPDIPPPSPPQAPPPDLMPGPDLVTPPQLTCLGSQTLIRGNHFTMGSMAGAGDADEEPSHPVTLSPYCIDVTEVTVAAYSRCVMAGRCTAPDTGPGCNWDAPSRSNHPINCVDWSQAQAYCQWVGTTPSLLGRLPTEAEWEFGARGTDGRIYPWKDLPPSTQLCWSGDIDRLSTCPVTDHPAGVSPFQLFDMAGNVWEWVQDAYGPYPGGPVTDPLGGNASDRVYRGGGFDLADPLAYRATNRAAGPPAHRYPTLGFRCVRVVR